MLQLGALDQDIGRVRAISNAEKVHGAMLGYIAFMVSPGWLTSICRPATVEGSGGRNQPAVGVILGGGVSVHGRPATTA